MLSDMPGLVSLLCSLGDVNAASCNLTFLYQVKNIYTPSKEPKKSQCSTLVVDQNQSEVLISFTWENPSLQALYQDYSYTQPYTTIIKWIEYIYIHMMKKILILLVKFTIIPNLFTQTQGCFMCVI